MDEVKKPGRPVKAKDVPSVSKTGTFIYQKVKLEISGYKDNKPVFKEGSVIRECKISELDAGILNSQQANTLIRYKKK